MIISQKKPLDQILDALTKYQKIFIVGCNLCASLCQSGGEKEVLQIREELLSSGKDVAGLSVVEAACHLLETKKELRDTEEEISQADAILSLACGAGSQTLASFIEKPVFTAVDTLFLGTVQRWGSFSEVCSQCGECVLNLTGGICPITRCPKGLLNGPCGGMNNGKCECDPDRDCTWVQIYETLKRQGRLEEFKRIQPPRDNSNRQRPGKLYIKRER